LTPTKYDICNFIRVGITSTYPRYGVNWDILCNHRFSEGSFLEDYLHTTVIGW
jgi:hypothetical protein